MQAELRRLARLVGTDAGFYVLALHSFVEHYIRDIAHASDSESFHEVVQDFRDLLLNQADGTAVDGLSSLASLGRQHRFINSARYKSGILTLKRLLRQLICSLSFARWRA